MDNDREAQGSPRHIGTVRTKHDNTSRLRATCFSTESIRPYESFHHGRPYQWIDHGRPSYMDDEPWDTCPHARPPTRNDMRRPMCRVATESVWGVLHAAGSDDFSNTNTHDDRYTVRSHREPHTLALTQTRILLVVTTKPKREADVRYCQTQDTLSAQKAINRTICTIRGEWTFRFLWGEWEEEDEPGSTMPAPLITLAPRPSPPDL